MSKLVQPKLRFNNLNSSWKNYLFHETFLIHKSNSLSREDLNDAEGKIKNIHYGDIHTKFKSLLDITKENIPFINVDKLEKVKNMSFCEEGDLIFADASEDYKDIGKAIEIINLDNQNVLSGLHTIFAKKKFNIYLGLCGYLFQSWKIRKQIMFFSQGTKVLGLPKKYIEKINLYIPENISEQQKIASFLSSVDKKIELLTKKHEQLEKYKKGLMQKIFSQEIRFKQDDGSDFSDWNFSKLSSLSDVRDGTHESPKYIKDGFPLITSKNLLKDGNLDFKNTNFITQEDFKSINLRSKVDIGDIIFGMIGTIGNPVLLKEDGFAIKNVALIKEKKQLLNKFFIYYLHSNSISKQFYILNTGGTQKFISLSVLRGLLINFPSSNEQQKIASFLSALDKKIDLAKQQIEKTQTFKKGLLQQMFV